MSRIPIAPVRLRTTEMAYGPHAVARHDGKVVFVRGAGPDEELDAIITEERRSFAYADAVRVVCPSASRRHPPCPYLPRCGGCPWQHLDYRAQLEAKRRIVQEHLRRFAGVGVDVEPVVPSPLEYEYRRRLKLRVERGEVGFYAGATHSLVPIEHCLLAEPSVAAAIPWVAELSRSLQTNLRRIELIRTREEAPDVTVVAEAEGSWVKADHAFCRSWLEGHSHVRGLTISGRRWKRTWGQAGIAVRPDERTVLDANAGSFTQVNAAANLSLVETVGRLAQVRRGERVLDLYAGVGNFSIPFARCGARVLAVEQHPQAARDNAANARRLRLTGYEVRQGLAEHVVARLVEAGERFDVVVLDPPRSGARLVIEGLLRLAAPRVVYVSCDPATLARDVRRLGSHYRIETVQPIDMFPHTYHVEVVVHAQLVSSPR